MSTKEKGDILTKSAIIEGDQPPTRIILAIRARKPPFFEKKGGILP
jgi:hypothetical protein